MFNGSSSAAPGLGHRGLVEGRTKFICLRLAQFHQHSATCKLQKAIPFLLIFQNVGVYKITELFEGYDLHRVGEIGP